jgi:hypothetical protein
MDNAETHRAATRRSNLLVVAQFHLLLLLLNYSRYAVNRETDKLFEFHFPDIRKCLISREMVFFA